MGLGLPNRARVVIVGAGIAGLSTAAHLARAGVTGIVLLDREAAPGLHASSHNAAIARQLTGEREHTVLAIEGRQRLAAAGLLTQTGGLLLACDPDALAPLSAEAEAFGLEIERGSGAGLPGLLAGGHLRVPGDGVIDVHGLLMACKRDALDLGVSLRTGCEVLDIRADAQGFTLLTTNGPLHAERLVNAAGAWAGPLGTRCGGSPLQLHALRRHLAWSATPCKPGPYAWWVDRPLYLRPESGGLLLCPCDEDAYEPPTVGRQPSTSDAALHALALQVADLAPNLAQATIARHWAGLRTFAPDRRFVVGWDPLNPRLFWVAGLGGHGMTTGLAVGRLAADLFQTPARHPLGPERFAGGLAAS